MKVHFVRGIDVHDGKGQQAWEWAIKIANYVNENYPEAEFEVVQQIGGETNRVVWVSPFESLAVLEAYIEKTGTDEGFQQLLAEAGEQGLFIGSSLRDGIYGVRS